MTGLPTTLHTALYGNDCVTLGKSLFPWALVSPVGTLLVESDHLFGPSNSKIL